jgi:enolase
MEIKAINIRTIFDSRANKTIEAEIVTAAGDVFRGIIPAGKSTGENEATIIAPSEAKNVVVTLIAPVLVGKSFSSMREFDGTLLALDSSAQKEKIGGNIVLGFSFAMLRAFAHEQKVEPWEILRKEYFAEVTDAATPHIFANLVNGGAHAANNLSIQEYMVVVPTTEPTLEADITNLITLHKDLGERLKKERNLPRVAIGDESGYAIDFENNYAPIALLDSMIEERKLNYRIGLDVAASGFFTHGVYSVNGDALGKRDMLSMYAELISKTPRLYSIEDPFEEHDNASFAALQAAHPELIVVGDDLTTTNQKTIEACADAKEISGVIIKPNQIGSVSETCDAIRSAHAKNVKTIISHRSGETEDNMIIQIAKASNAHGVKIGAPLRERIFKYNEILRIYKNK